MQARVSSHGGLFVSVSSCWIRACAPLTAHNRPSHGRFAGHRRTGSFNDHKSVYRYQSTRRIPVKPDAAAPNGSASFSVSRGSPDACVNTEQPDPKDERFLAALDV